MKNTKLGNQVFSTCSKSWQLIAFEELRSCFMQAHLAFAEAGNIVGMARMRALYNSANRAIVKLGGEAIELADLESLVLAEPF
jgi:hypothetical protein